MKAGQLQVVSVCLEAPRPNRFTAMNLSRSDRAVEVSGCNEDLGISLLLLKILGMQILLQR
jgi:hypothetical protein